MTDSLENENKLLKQEVGELKQQLEDYKKSLKQKDKYYQQIIDSVGAHIYWKDLEGKMLGSNQSNLESTRFDKIEDIIGKTEDNISINRDFSEAIKVNDAKVLSNGKNMVFEETNKIGDKEFVYLSTKSCLRNNEDKIIGLVGVSVDITDLKKLQNRVEKQNKSLDLLSKNQTLQFQQIIDSINANVYWKDLDGKILGINKSNLKSLKLNSVEEIIGKTDYELNTNKSFKNIMKNDIQVIESGKSIIFEEEYIIDNTVTTLLSTKSPLKDKEDKVIGIIGISVDITDRKQMQNKIEEQNKELKKKDEVKTEFIENFSHDVKVPINALVGRTQLLKLISAKDKNEKLAKIAKDVEDSSMILNTLFAQMRNIVIHEQFDNKLYNTKFYLSSLIEKEIEMAKASVPNHKNINIDFHSEDDLSFKVNTDHYKLSQIIRNLLSNAIKFTDEGNVSVETETIRNTDNQASFKLIVADTGIGIDKAHQDNIFELFDRANITSHNNNRHGMGLGLYIVKNNLNILGGSIGFESHLGQGSKFFVDIPLRTV